MLKTGLLAHKQLVTQLVRLPVARCNCGFGQMMVVVMGHVAYVTSASGANSIQVMESNYAGNMSIGNYRGTFDPTSSAHGGSVYYIYP